MKIVLISNYFNHHQKPFSDAMFKLIGEEYNFIETEPMSEERLKMGWGGENKPAYVKQNFTNENSKLECQNIIDQADVVIFGSAPRELLVNRIKKKKTIFFYSERPLKEKSPLWKYPFRLFTWRRLNPQRKNICMLCASAYTATDYAKFGLYRKKCYKWGYFTRVKEYEDIDDLISKKTPNSLLWCARFIDWKHPEHAIEIAKRLKADGYDFNLNMIGNGELENQVAELIRKNGLSDCVHLLGAMKPEKVREYMEKSEIFLFTSDRKEGWGAVLNESMNSACAVVASHAIGAVPFLIQNKENGLIYKNGDVGDLYNKVKLLLDNSEKRKTYAKIAYYTMLTLWNPSVVAERFLQLAKNVLEKGSKNMFFEGPCSLARRLKDNWFIKTKD